MHVKNFCAWDCHDQIRYRTQLVSDLDLKEFPVAHTARHVINLYTRFEICHLSHVTVSPCDSTSPNFAVGLDTEFYGCAPKSSP